MWHSLLNVAAVRRLDYGKLKDYAMQNGEKYAVLHESKGLRVSTWHVDAMVKDFLSQDKPTKEST